MYEYPLVQVNMTDRDVIERVALVFRTKVFVGKPIPPSKLTYYRAAVQGKRAVSIMREILPFMGLRRSQKIADVIRAWEERPDMLESRVSLCRESAKTRWRNRKGSICG